MFRCDHHHQGAYYVSLLKLHLLKQWLNTSLWLIWWCGCICFQVLVGVCLLHCSEPDQSAGAILM